MKVVKNGFEQNKSSLLNQREFDIPEALDFAILEYASKKRYIKQSKFVWTLRLAAAIAVVFCGVVVLESKFEKRTNDVQIATNSDTVINQQIVVEEETSYNEYDEFTSALAAMNESFNQKYEEISETVENELTTELVLVQY